MNKKVSEEETFTKSGRSGSIKSWPPPRSAWGNRVSKRRKRKFVFDHLWGIPGGLHKQDLLLLRNLHKRREECSNNEELNNKSIPFLILNEREILENRDYCCNHSLGRTFREFAWHTSLHGFKYLTYCRHHPVERAFWGIICSILLVYGAFISYRIIEFYGSSNKSVTVIESIGDPYVSFPNLIFCPSSETLDENSMGSKFPAFSKTAWDKFSISGPRDPDPWINITSLKIRRFLQEITIEGGVMSVTSCKSLIVECIIQGKPYDCCQSAVLELTTRGPCYYLPFGKPTKSKRRNLGHFMQNVRKDLNVSMKLTGTFSNRVGYPVVNISFWGESGLCGTSWSDKEANVICKSLGFTDGQRYFMAKRSDYPMMNLLGQLNCSGNESNISECAYSYENYDGKKLTECDKSYPTAILCDIGGLQSGLNDKTTTRGMPYLLDSLGEKTFFCEDEFSDREALVFCNMMSWRFGRVIISPNETIGSSSRYTNTKCSGKESHILDCSHTWNASPTSCPSTFIECSPGFPLTLRILNPLESQMKEITAQLVVGYPVIDTPNKPGYICDSELINVSEVICRSLGFSFGRKLSPKTFEFEFSSSKLFVLKKAVCSGNESSFFECALGLWGDHGDDNSCKEPLSIACSNLEKLDDLSLVFLDSVDYSELNVVDTPNALVAVSMAGKFVPVCDDDGWTDTEADALCTSRGFDCGMSNRRAGYILDIPPLERFPQFFQFFARISCQATDNCSIGFKTGCLSAKGVSAFCLNASDDEIRVCHLLRETKDFLQDPYPEVRIRFSLPSEESCLVKNRLFFSEKDGLEISQGVRIKGTLSGKTLRSSPRVLERLNIEESGCRSHDRSECISSCKLFLVEKICHCIPWFDSRVPGNEKIEICYGKNNSCYQKIKRAVSLAVVNVSLAVLGIEKIGLWRPHYRTALESMCDCPPSCNPTSDYRLDSVHHGKIDSCSLTTTSGVNGEIELLLDRDSSISYYREIFFPWEYIFGIIGGILTIFIGFSFVAILEVIYFFTVRWCENRTLLPPEYEPNDLKDWSSKWRNKTLEENERTLSDPDLTKTSEKFWDELETAQLENQTRKLSPLSNVNNVNGRNLTKQGSGRKIQSKPDKSKLQKRTLPSSSLSSNRSIKK